jgi:peptidoglycan/LPS O-acetylase OafA/YrhL
MFDLNINYDKRVFGLDLLRFVAIFFVLVEHGTQLLKPILYQIEKFNIFGFFGVEIFFILSGFLIGTILIKTYEQEKRLSIKIIWNFWIRRWFRTIPNYYLILIANLLLAGLFGTLLLSKLQIISYFFFLQNSVKTHPMFFGEAWSLAVEEWFYLTFPIFLLISSKILKTFGTYSIKQKNLIGIVAFYLCIFSLRFLVVSIKHGNWDSNVRKLMPLRLDSIVIGVFVAWGNFYYYRVLNKLKNYFIVLSVTLLLFCIWYYYTYIAFNMYDSTIFSKTFYFLLVDLSFAFLLSAANQFKVIKQNILSRSVINISIISYSVYLLHSSLIINIIQRYNKPYDLCSSIIDYSFFWMLTILFSILLYKYFEHPTTLLRDKFKLKNKKPIVFK